MRINQQKFCLEYTTAPSLRESSDQTMLPIQLKLPYGSSAYDGAKMYERLLAGKLRGLGSSEFREQLPAFLNGEPTDWTLWNVRMLSQELQLLFSRQHPPVRPQADDPFTDTASLEAAQLTLRASEGMVCDFVIPPMLGEPEKTVRYHFTRYRNATSPHDTCELNVTEVVGDQVSFRCQIKTLLLTPPPEKD